MKRVHENVKEFNNGNISIRFSRDDLQQLFAGKISAIEVLSYILEEIDCYFIGYSFCLSNYDTGSEIYNAYSDLCYIISHSDIDNILLAGKRLKLYAFNPSEVDREIIENEFGG